MLSIRRLCLLDVIFPNLGSKTMTSAERFTKAPLYIKIVGAGISGLSAAISCALAGHYVQILEAAKELAEVRN